MKKIYTALFCLAIIRNVYGDTCPPTYPNNVPDTNLCYLITEPGEYVPTPGAGVAPCPAGDYCPGGDKIYYNINIPDRYKPVEYLENNNTAYIDTGHIPTPATTVSADVLITGGNRTESYAWIPFLGTRAQSDAGGTYGTKRYSFFIQANSGIPNFDYFNTALSTYTAGGNFMNKRFNMKTQISDNQIHTLVDNIVAYSTPVVSAPDFQRGIYLFAMANDAVSGNRNAYGRFYSYQARESDELVQDMIPAYDTTSEQYGMYDIIGNKFFTSANDDKFTGGPFLETTGGNYSCAVATDNQFISSPQKSETVTDCGKILHIGNHKLYLRRRQITHPALAVQWRDAVLYAEMSTEKRGHLRTTLHGVVYSIFNTNAD